MADIGNYTLNFGSGALNFGSGRMAQGAMLNLRCAQVSLAEVQLRPMPAVVRGFVGPR